MASNRKVAKGASSGRPRSYSELYRNSKEATLGNETVHAASSRAGSSVAGSATMTRQERVDWRTEYAHVFNDLRRLGIISAVLILAMIAASFFL